MKTNLINWNGLYLSGHVRKSFRISFPFSLSCVVLIRGKEITALEIHNGLESFLNKHSNIYVPKVSKFVFETLWLHHGPYDTYYYRSLFKNYFLKMYKRRGISSIKPKCNDQVIIKWFTCFVLEIVTESAEGLLGFQIQGA